MLLTEQGKEFLKNKEQYFKLGLTQIVNIVGPDIIKDNIIFPIGTICLKNDEGHSLFVADYCTPEELQKLIQEIKENNPTCVEIPIEISKSPTISQLQENLIYLAYSDPDIRPIIYKGKVTINDTTLSINEGKLLVDGEELQPYSLLIKVWGEAGDKSDIITLINKKIEEHEKILQSLKLLMQISQAESSTPKVITVKDEEKRAILYIADKNYAAIALDDKGGEPEYSYKIKSSLKWNDIKQDISDFGKQATQQSAVDFVEDGGMDY